MVEGRSDQGGRYGPPWNGELLRDRRRAPHGRRRRRHGAPRGGGHEHAAVPLHAHGPARRAARPRQPGEARAGDDPGRGREHGHPGGLHVPRAVHRPRPHLRQDEGRRSGTNVAPVDLAAGPLARARPRLALRRRAGRPEVGASSTRDDRHLKVGKTVEAGADAARDGFDLPRVGTGSFDAEAQGARPRPAQRREPRRRADPRRVHPLPQPRRRQGAAERDARRAALPHGARDRRQALPVDAAPRLPAADLRPGGGRRRLHQRPQGVRGRRGADGRPDDADRVQRRRVPARALDDPRGLQLERALPDHARRAVLPVRLQRDERRPAAERLPAAAEQLDRRLAAALRLQGRGGAQRSRGPGQAQPRDADRHATCRTRCATCRRLVRRARPCRSTTRTPTSRSATSRGPRW